MGKSSLLDSRVEFKRAGMMTEKDRFNSECLSLSHADEKVT